MEETKPTKQRKVVLGSTVDPETQERVADLAEKRSWSLAQTGGYLIQLGLEKLQELADCECDSLTLNA